MPDPKAVIVTCEHGGNRVPAPYAHLFANRGRLLNSHKGYDLGALELARKISSLLQCPIYFSTVTRLLVDLNRSPHNHRKFSDAVRPLSPEKKGNILRRYYWPYREAVQSEVGRLGISRGTVLHLSVHSFTPVLKGRGRTADIGLLYDPARKTELEFCQRWRKAVLSTDGSLNIRRNYPYLGVSDGMASYLRTRYPAKSYLGIELEINQKYPSGDRQRWNALQSIIVNTLKGLLSST